MVRPLILEMGGMMRLKWERGTLYMMGWDEYLKIEWATYLKYPKFP